MDYLALFLSFVLGMIANKLFGSFIALGQLSLMVKKVEKDCLMMLASSSESVAYIQSIKFLTMTDLKLDENTIKLAKNVDEHNFKRWKRAAITNLHESYPKMFKDSAKYYDWETATGFLDRIYRQNRLDKK